MLSTLRITTQPSASKVYSHFFTFYFLSFSGFPHLLLIYPSSSLSILILICSSSFFFFHCLFSVLLLSCVILSLLHLLQVNRQLPFILLFRFDILRFISLAIILSVSPYLSSELPSPSLFFSLTCFCWSLLEGLILFTLAQLTNTLFKEKQLPKKSSIL